MTHPAELAIPLHDLVTRDRSWSSVTLVVDEVIGPTAIADRLKALGFCHGRKITVIRSGDPAIVELLGTRVGMSAAIAQYVKVLREEALPPRRTAPDAVRANFPHVAGANFPSANQAIQAS